ncbi:MAG: YbhN family protein [Acidimicrobiia bacterium]|nr:YbhN family protein [Acidimicrobiia bacterium]MDH5238394.1 YbhN family protein [Acidimicrobiia bacterium]
MAPRDQRARVLPRVLGLLLTAITLYLVFPSVVEVLSSWDEVLRLQPLWLVVVFGCQVASFACLWALQRMVLRTTAWVPIITTQLAGNAASRVIPGGAAAGTTVQYRMLRTAGIGTANAASGLAAAGLLQIGIICALPLVALPAVLLGAPAPQALLNATWLGAGLFVLVALLVVWMVRHERPLRMLGVTIDRIRSRFGRRVNQEDLADRLLIERDLIRRELGSQWGKTLALAIGRAMFDYLTLLTALAAFHVDARASLVLLVYASAALLAMVPLTPGGLGFVEAGLTGTLALAGASPAESVSVALLYRLASFWLPIPAGMVAAGIHRYLYRAVPVE